MRFSWVLALCAAALLLAGSGCGSSAYEAKLSKQVDWYKFNGQFGVLHDQPLTLDGTSISLRIPRVFKQALTEKSASPETPTMRIDPRRVKPEFLLDFPPGYKITFQTPFPTKDQKEVPAQMYIWAVPLKSLKGDTAKLKESGLERDLLERVHGNVSKKGKWRDVECSIPVAEGGQPQTTTWRQLSSTGRMLVAKGYPNSRPEPSRDDVEFNLWLRKSQDHLVVLGFSVPKDVVGKSGVSETLQKLVCGTLTGGDDEPAAEPASAK